MSQYNNIFFRGGVVPQDQVQDNIIYDVQTKENSIPLYTDADGNPSYDNNQSWFETFSDRRLFAQTGGGAGYWGFGWRTPARYFYDNAIGLDPNAIVDPVWEQKKKDPEWVDSRVKQLESSLGPQAIALKQDHGELILRNIVLNGVSLDDETARLTFALDSSLSRRRIEEYDEASSLGTYLGTKVTSAVGNYMATDPITTVTTIASLGASSILPAAARGIGLSRNLPWLRNSSEFVRGWLATHGPTIAKTNLAFSPIDGALSGYASHYGWNADLSILNPDAKSSALYDENMSDDIAIGAGIGIAGGLLGYGLTIQSINRNAAIEVAAQAGIDIPSREALDFRVRYTNQHSNLLRNLRSIGVDMDGDIGRRVNDPQFLYNNGYRSPEDIAQLDRVITQARPTETELGNIIAAKAREENNRSFNFRRRIDKFFENMGVVYDPEARRQIDLPFDRNDLPPVQPNEYVYEGGSSVGANPQIQAELRKRISKINDDTLDMPAEILRDDLLKRTAELNISAQILEEMTDDEIKDVWRAYRWKQERINVLRNYAETQPPRIKAGEEGEETYNYAGHSDKLNTLLSADTERYLIDTAGLSRKQIDDIRAWINSRAGLSEIDFHYWVQVANPSMATIMDLMKFIDEGSAAQRTIITKLMDTVGMEYPRPKGISGLDASIDIMNTRRLQLERNYFSQLFSNEDSPYFKENHPLAGLLRTITDFGNDTREAARKGLNPKDGYTGELVNAQSRKPIERERKRALRQLAKMVKRGEVLAKDEKIIRDYIHLRFAEVELDIARMREGQLGEILGLFNNHILERGDNPDIINGSFPLMTRRDEDIVMETGFPLATRRVNPDVENSRFKGVYDRTSEFELPVPSTLTRFAMARRSAKADAAVLRGYNKVVKGLNRILGDMNTRKLGDNPRLTFTTADGTQQWGEETDGIIISGFGKDGTEKIKMSGKDMNRVFTDDSLNKAVEEGDASLLVVKPISELEEQGKVLKDLADSSQKTLNQANVQNMMNLSLRDDDWQFANANVVTRALRNIPGGESLWSLARMTMNNPIVGLRAGGLWFNQDAITRRGAFSQILLFSNLIDSPHVLRRDIGHLAEDGLFSVQHLRNWNAVAANRVISVIRRFSEQGDAVIPNDHVAVMNSIRQFMFGAEEGIDVGPPIVLTPKQQALRDAVEEFFDSFANDIANIIDIEGIPAVGRDQLFTLLSMVPNRGVILARGGEMRQTMRAIATELHEGVVNRLRQNAEDINIGDIARFGGMDPDPTLWNIGNIIPAGNLDAAINAATDRAALLSLMNIPADENRRTFGIRNLIDQITDIEVANMTNVNDFFTVLESKRANQEWTDFFNGRITAWADDLDPMNNMFRRDPRTGITPTMNALQTAGLANINDEIFSIIRTDGRMGEFFHGNLADMVIEFGSGIGTRIRTQAQISRTFPGNAQGQRGVFAILAEARNNILQAAANTGDFDLGLRVRNQMNHLEDMMAHALGFSLESNPRFGVGEGFFRFQNGLIRAGAGAFWGLQTAIAEVPKAILLNANRNGFINAFLDTLSAITTRSDLDDIGAALEQFTRRFSLGVDNEAFMGGVQFSSNNLINRPVNALGRGMANLPLVGGAFQRMGLDRASLTANANLNPLVAGRRVLDIARGRTVDPNGITRSLIEEGAPQTMGGSIIRQVSQVADATVNAVESVANANVRLGGQHFFAAIGRDIAVRGAKKTLVRDIARIRTFARDLAGVWTNRNGQQININALPNFNARLAAFKELAQIHGLDWGFAARLNHHGMLNQDTLELLERAFMDPDVVRRTRTLGMQATDTFAFDSHALRRFIEAERGAAPRMAEVVLATNRAVPDVDRIMTGLTAVLEEEANTAVVSATAIASIPNANLFQRFMGQFSNYTRGFQHQAFLRGANDSNINKMIMMMLPVLIGELLYVEGKRIIEARQYKGPDSVETTFEDIKKSWRQQPEVALARAMSRVPIGGPFQSFFLNNIASPLDMSLLPSTADFRPFGTPSPAQQIAHKGLYWGVETMLDIPILNRMTGGIEVSDLIQRETLGTQTPRFTGFEFTPYKDSFNMVKDITEWNPYRDYSKKYFAIPSVPSADNKTIGKIWSFVPGVRTWQFQSALRGMGIYGYEEDPRAYRWTQWNESQKKRGIYK